MKTHLPTSLRKALLAAIAVVSAVAYNASADTAPLNAVDATFTYGGKSYTQTGYADLTFTGGSNVVGTAKYGVHSGVNHDYEVEVTKDIEVTRQTSGDYNFVINNLVTTADGNMPTDKHTHASSSAFALGSYSEGNVAIHTGSVKVTTADIAGKLTLGDATDKHTESGYAGKLLVEGGLSAGNIRMEDASSLTIKAGGVAVDDTVDVVQGSSIVITGQNEKRKDNGLAAGIGIRLRDSSLESKFADVYTSPDEFDVTEEQTSKAPVFGISAWNSSILMKDGDLKALGGGSLEISGGSLTATRDLDILGGSSCKVSTQGGGDIEFYSTKVNVQDDISSSGDMWISASEVTLTAGGSLDATGQMSLSSWSTVNSIEVNAGSIVMDDSSTMIVYVGGSVESQGMTSMYDSSVIDVDDASLTTQGLYMRGASSISAVDGIIESTDLTDMSSYSSIDVRYGSLTTHGLSMTVRSKIDAQNGRIESDDLTKMSYYSTIDLRNGRMETAGLTMDMECGIDATQGGVIIGEGDISLSESSEIVLDDYAKLENVGDITVASHSSITATYRSQIINEGDVTVTGNGSFISMDKGDITVTEGCLTAEKWGKVEVSVGNIYTEDMLAATSGTIVVTEGDVVATGDVSVTKDSSILVDGHVTADSIHVDGANAVLQVSNVTVEDKLYVSNSGLAETGSVDGSVEVTHARLDAAGVSGDAVALEGGVLNLESVEGKVTADASSVVVDSSIGAGVEASNNATVQAASITGSVAAASHAKVEAKVLRAEEGTVSATGEDTLIRIAEVLEAESVEVDKKAVVEAMTITADTVNAESGATVKVRDTITADVTGGNAVIVATGDDDKGLTIAGDVASTESIFTAAQDSAINITDNDGAGGNLSGDGNVLGMDTAMLSPLASDIHVKGDISGDGNELYATNNTVSGKLSTMSAAAISGNGNTLNVMNEGGTDADVVIGGDISGDENDIIIDGKGDVSIGSIIGDGNTIVIAEGGDITIDSVLGQSGEHMADGNTLATMDGDVEIGSLGNSSCLSVGAGNGSITVRHAATVRLVDSALEAGEDITIGESGTSGEMLTLDEGSMLVSETGSVSVAQSATLLGSSSIEADEDIFMSGPKTTVRGEESSLVSTNGSVNISGDTATLEGGAKAEAKVGSVDMIAGTNTVSMRASVEAGSNITMTGSLNRLETGVSAIAGQDVLLTAEETNVLIGHSMVQAGGEIMLLGTKNTLDGADLEAAGDVSLAAETRNTLAISTVTAGNDVVLAGTTEVVDSVLTAGGHIQVTEGTVVNLLSGATAALDGNLAGVGTVVSGAEDLVRTQDDTAFSGTVDMREGRSLTVAGKGLGTESTVNLGEHSYLFVSGDGSSLGTVKVGRDGGIAMTPAPASAKLMARGVAYAPAVNHATADILDFAGKNSMYGVEVLGGDADCITVTGLVKADPAKTSVYVANEADLAAQQDGTYTIIKLADGAAMEGGMNTDVAYTMQGSQRALVGKNLAVVNTAKGVDLVVSTNAYGTQAVANKKAVQAPLAALSAQVDHSTGALDGAEDEMLQVLNALDHTTAAGDAAHALQQLSAVGNLIAPNMMIDTTRHHMDTLRQHMSAASCAEDGRKTSHVWAAYQGGHDVLGGDEAMDDVKTSYQGALVGVDFSLNCNASVGISLGYENAEGRSAGDRAETDTLYLDLYATAKTGSFIHRVSLGMAMYDFDVTRHVAVAAGNRSYSGTSRGSMDAMSWTLGYEVSRPCALGEHAMLTPFAQVDVALHTLDSLHSNGQGRAEVATDYDDMCRVDVALGAAWQYAFANGVSTSARLALHGDLGDERVSGTNRFAAGGPAWQTEGLKRTPLYGELGGGISVPLGSSWTGAANVGFEFGGDRTSVGGNVGVNYAF